TAEEEARQNRESDSDTDDEVNTDGKGCISPIVTRPRSIVLEHVCYPRGIDGAVANTGLGELGRSTKRFSEVACAIGVTVIRDDIRT
ncbi:hypothetical protein CPC16_011075, partial [Podila verticillata]